MKIDLSGKTIVITGGSSGIGAAAAKALSARGAHVAITGRSSETDRLANEIGADAFHVDFGELRSVKSFSQALLAKFPKIDVLANNVGGIFNDRRLTIDGHETTFQVNHLAGFYLTTLLRSRLEESQASIINTSSFANWFGHVDLNDLENAKNYNAGRAYGTAKLMNILHVQELQRRFKGVHTAAFHPGPVATGFAREGGTFAKLIYETPLKNLFLISPEKGAETLNWLASTEGGKDWQSGAYYAKKRIASTNSQAKNAALAHDFWDASEALLSQLS